MKCPKCGYIGFQPAERCRNCGYDFTLAGQPPLPPDLALRDDEAGGPLADLPLDRARPSAEVVRPRPARATSEEELPLFASGDEGLAARGTPIPAPRAPLAVRRTPPSVARPKPRPFAPRVQPELELEAPPLEPTPAEGAMREDDHPERAPGVWRRLASAAIDAFLLLGVNLIILYFTLRVCRLTSAQIALLPIAPMLAFLAIVDGGYLWAFTAAGGQTIGKMALGLRAVGRDGAALAPGRAVARAALSLMSAAPLGVGLASALFGRGRRALHDWLAGTSVERVSRR